MYVFVCFKILNKRMLYSLAKAKYKFDRNIVAIDCLIFFKASYK